MSNRNFCAPFRSNNPMENPNRCKLPAINNGLTTLTNANSYVPRKNNDNYPNRPNSSLRIDYGSALCNTRTSAYENSKIVCPTRDITPSQRFSSPPLNPRACSDVRQIPLGKDCSAKQFNDSTKMIGIRQDIDKTMQMNRSSRPMTSGSNNLNYSSETNGNVSNRQKMVVRDRQLANEILQKAGIASTLTSNDCLEVITDSPVTMNEPVNCDPNPLCMKKPADCQECYEQSIVVRHLQPPRPPMPPPIIIRERCAPQPPPQSPIVIRQIPPRPCTPPALIIRECPPPMLEMQEPTIIEREIPPPPLPPRQVIVERLPTPPAKPRPIIFEKWLPYEEPEDRPCIVEKAATNDTPPPKNVIIQYEALEPKIQLQCVNEGISYVDPKQFINQKPNGNAEVCYVDQLNNLPDHIKCQLSPQTLAAIGIQNTNNKQNTNERSFIARSNPPSVYQQTGQSSCNPYMYRQQQPNNHSLSASIAGLSQCYNANPPFRPVTQGFTNFNRAQYNPWATTYQISYTNKARGLCRAR
ncbi:unnamed protein product [Adineta ricciae]|uniref:Uncharacterized protein n=1 Tax=Adineta ricciae TaxID=249248 RepID=A0A815Q4Z2_ADIRI|nr:unnamed protein product [Adineta ricciae]